MSTAEPDQLEEQVRKLHSVGLSTRKIAQTIGDISQSTVVRTLQKINSGPQPILPDETSTSQQLQASLARVALVAWVVLLTVTFVVLTAAVATLAWR